MARGIIISIFVLLISSLASAGLFIAEPLDKTTTFSRVIMLKGAVRDVAELKINNQAIEFFPDGKFTCGLVLRPGKNLVEVKTQDTAGKVLTKKVRLLYLVNYPDMESLFDGQEHWARPQVVYLSTLGFIEGEPDDNFYPSNPISRGELATWLARVKKLQVSALIEDVFFDVPKEHWRAPYIKAVVDAGYMMGYDNQTFGLDDPLSRRHAAAIVTLAEGIDVIEGVKSLFVDVKRAEKGALPIYIAKEKGLIKGVSTELPIFEPERAMTRAEAAVLLGRFQRSHMAIQYLFNFNQGFSPQVYCGLNTAPKILSFVVQPETIKLNRKTTVNLTVKIAPRENFQPVAKVTVDLSELGGAADAPISDALNINLEPKLSGTKTLRVTAIDKLGWQTEGEAQLTVTE
ncbi:S-layer homology domain-containing protein [Candidatus Saganbacteria bacterium]|nr:S-layer homology domain-containing protein [Candidatus Saganbacteria bacterium]